MVGCATKKPAAVASQAIGPGGGSVTQGAVTLTIPAGAVASTQTITVTQVAAGAPTGYSSLSPLYQFGPDGLVFAQPVTVSLPFAGNATAPTIYWSNASGGYDAMATTISGTTAQAQIAHFSSGFVAEKPQAETQTPSTAKALTAFSFAALSITATIDEDAKTIAATVPAGTDVTALVATFATTGASVSVGTTAQVSATTANDFSNPVTYTVTAADSSTASYTATVTVAAPNLSSAKAITAFSLGSFGAGTIDENAKTISFTEPAETVLTGLIATFTTTGASVSIGSAVQVSGTTSHDFTSPVVYTVTAADASTASYTVTVLLLTLGAPVITYPVAGSLAPPVVQPATVQGTAEANATIDVAVMNGDTVLGTATGAADGDGVFNLEVASYAAPSFGTALTLSVTQTLASETSPPATLGVEQGITAVLPISVSQTSGATTGTTTHVRVFVNGSASLPLQEHSFTVAAGENESGDQFTFDLPTGGNGGSFYFFSFRDSNNNGVFDSGEPTFSAQKAVFQNNNPYAITLQPIAD
jgi:hypothetical protein